MDKRILGLVLVGLAIGLAVLLRQAIAQRNQRALNRAAYFDACKPIFSNLIEAVTPHGFARLSGQYLGQVFDLQAVPDTLTFRKLPALWVLVTLPMPLPLHATVDLMIRPIGGEPFSNFDQLADQVQVPAGFPEDCALRSDAARLMPPESLLRRHLSIFDDARVKELVISPKGVRLVWLAQEANRSRYLLFRDAEMGQEPFARRNLEPLMAAVMALRADVLASQEKERLIA